MNLEDFLEQTPRIWENCWLGISPKSEHQLSSPDDYQDLFKQELKVPIYGLVGEESDYKLSPDSGSKLKYLEKSKVKKYLEVLLLEATFGGEEINMNYPEIDPRAYIAEVSQKIMDEAGESAIFFTNSDIDGSGRYFSGWNALTSHSKDSLVGYITGSHYRLFITGDDN